MKALVLLLLASSLNLWQPSQAAKILCLVGTPERNYPGWTLPLFEALAGRGHALTVMSTAPDPEVKGIQHIRLANTYDVVKKYYVSEVDGYFHQNWNGKQMVIWYEELLASCRALDENECGPRKILEDMNDDFDLIINDATYTMDCLLLMATKYRHVPVLSLSGGKLTTDVMRLMQAENTINPGEVPHFLSDFPGEMSYLERMQNSLLYLGQSVVRWALVNHKVRALATDGYKPEPRVMLVNTHPVLDYIQNMPPNVIEVGGLHIRPESFPLPLAIQEFVERYPEGFIFINLPHIELMYGQGLLAIQNMIAEFNQFGFLLSLNGFQGRELTLRLPNLKTLLTYEILQQDILAQSNMKAFFTHGDSFSLQEAIYNAVPVVVLPVLMDQTNNAQRVDERKLGIRIQPDNFTVESFSSALKSLIRDEIFMNTLEQAQLNFRTRQVKPVDQAVWYAEQLVGQPDLFKYLARPETQKRSYIQTYSFDILFLPTIFFFCFFTNVIYYIVYGRWCSDPMNQPMPLRNYILKENLAQVKDYPKQPLKPMRPLMKPLVKPTKPRKDD